MQTKMLLPTFLFLLTNALACSSSGGSSPASSPASDGSGTTADGSGSTADAGGTTVSAGTTADGSGSTAADTSAAATSTTTTATAETATKLVFSSAVLVAVTDDCSAVSVQTQDANGAAANLLADHSIGFTSSTSTGHFYSDADCTADASSLTVATGANAGTIYFSDEAAGAPTITATDAAATPLAPASQIETITADTSAATGTLGSLAFSNSALSQAVGTCGMLTLSVYNAAGALTPLTATLQVMFTSSSATGLFYTDAGCTASFTTANLPVGLQSTNIYYKDSAASSAVLTASSVSGAYTAATQTEVISASSTPTAGLSTIDFISTNATSLVSRCVTTPFSIHNSLGQLSYFTTDVVIGLSTSTTAGAFYSDTACQHRVSAVTIPHGYSTFTLYYYSNLLNLNVLTVTPQVSGIATTSQNLYLNNK